MEKKTENGTGFRENRTEFKSTGPAQAWLAADPHEAAAPVALTAYSLAATPYGFIPDAPEYPGLAPAPMTMDVQIGVQVSAESLYALLCAPRRVLSFPGRLLPLRPEGLTAFPSTWAVRRVQVDVFSYR